MSIIWQLFVGLIIGVLARFLLPGKEAIASGILGWLVTAGIGMGGSLIGTLVGRAIWKNDKYKAGWILSILFAMGLLVLFRYMF